MTRTVRVLVGPKKPKGRILLFSRDVAWGPIELRLDVVERSGPDDPENNVVDAHSANLTTCPRKSTAHAQPSL